jgi:ribosomal protein L7/L12
VTVNDPKIGDFVYRHCHPLKPGIIVAVLGKDFGGHFVCVRVQWLGELSSRIETTADLKECREFLAVVLDQYWKREAHRSEGVQQKMDFEEKHSSGMSMGDLEIVRGYIKLGQQLQAIKHVRTVTSMGLFESKSLCDKLRNDMEKI